ncbi:MAG: response regulator, partial [Deltaproteobacteria bacterium]|nr:response regulator [Deltaproteobacteria bacterium]
MEQTQTTELEAFNRYVVGRNLTGARLGAVLAMILVPSGVVLDWLTNSEFLIEFLSLRMAASAGCLLVLAATYSRQAPRFTYQLGVAPVVISAIALEAMIVQLEGYSSPYYAGMMQLILAVGILFYWRLGQILLACSFIILIWLIVPQLVGIVIDDRGLFLNNFYALSIGALIAIASNTGRYRAIRNEHSARFQLAETSSQLASALERAQEVDRLKSEFFANISHELRTPLTLILSPVDELLTRTKPGAERDALKVVRRNANRLLRMIEDLLDLARLEAGGLRLRIMQFDPCDLARGVAENATPAARAKEIALIFDPNSTPAERYGDPHRIEIILTNLVGNALKFTPPGGQIQVSVFHNSAGTSVEVTDTGPGISREEQQRIFDRFHQTETSERRQQGGVGIGLALARELAQLHGGSLTVDSQLGEGSTFTLFLKSGKEHFHTEILERRQLQIEHHPGRRVEDRGTGVHTRRMEEATVEMRQSQRPPERILLDRGRLPRVLVAEDEADLRGFIVGVLKDTYEVDAAGDGAEAIELMKKNRPDLVLTDVMMPGTSGLDLTRAIKEDPSLRQIPVILLTARGESEAALEGYDAGADDFVSKPFHTQVLLARIRAHLKMRGLSLQLADQARLASAGTLAAGLAHEVKNPLNAALNAVRVLEKGGSARVSNDRLMTIVIDALKRIDGVISALDAHARPADGTDLAPCNVRTAVESTLNLLEHKMKGVTVHEDYEVTGDVFAPARAFNQVLLNLVDNSIRSGAENIWIELRQVDKKVSVAVADDGPGVPADVVHRIFDPFFTTRVEGEGTGLGLHLSRRIAQDCGGELR